MATSAGPAPARTGTGNAPDRQAKAARAGPAPRRPGGTDPRRAPRARTQRRRPRRPPAGQLFEQRRIAAAAQPVSTAIRPARCGTPRPAQPTPQSDRRAPGTLTQYHSRVAPEGCRRAHQVVEPDHQAVRAGRHDRSRLRAARGRGALAPGEGERDGAAGHEGAQVGGRVVEAVVARPEAGGAVAAPARTISWRAASRSRTQGWPLTLVITRRSTGRLPTLCTAGSISAPVVSIAFVQGTGPVRGHGAGASAATVGWGVVGAQALGGGRGRRRSGRADRVRGGPRCWAPADRSRRPRLPRFRAAARRSGWRSGPTAPARRGGGCRDVSRVRRRGAPTGPPRGGLPFVDRAAAGAGGVRSAGVPPTTTVAGPATVTTVASATHRRRQYTAAGSGPTGSHIHPVYLIDYSEWRHRPRRQRGERGSHTFPVHLADLVLDWYRANARDLPWRRPDTTPWGVLVSEFMLQQTPVARVEPVWLGVDAPLAAPSALAAALRATCCGPGASSATRGARCGCTRPRRDRGATRRRRPRRRGRAGGAAGGRLVHRPGGRRVRLRAAAARWSTPTCAACVARAVHGAGRRGPARTARRSRRRRRAAAGRGRAGRGRVGRADGARRGGVHGPGAALRRLPGAAGVRLVAAGRPAYTGPRQAVQGFAGTDRQVRGRLMDVLRDAPDPVPRAALERPGRTPRSATAACARCWWTGWPSSTTTAASRCRPDSMAHTVRFRLDPPPSPS